MRRLAPLLLAAAQLADADGNFALPTGTWRAWLDCPGGELPFLMTLEGAPGAYAAAVINGSERIAVPEFRATVADGVRLGFPHYDSEILARTGLDGARLDGVFRKLKDEGLVDA